MLVSQYSGGHVDTLDTAQGCLVTLEMSTAEQLLQKGMGICNPISHLVTLLGDLDALRALK